MQHAFDDGWNRFGTTIQFGEKVPEPIEITEKHFTRLIEGPTQVVQEKSQEFSLVEIYIGFKPWQEY